MYFRGSEPDLSQPYAVCLGSAHTFGRYVNRPYPEILQSNLNMQVLNLGRPAGHPCAYSTSDEIIDLINGSKFCVVQVFSARFSANSEVWYSGFNHFMYGKEKIPTMRYWKGKLSKKNKNTRQIIRESLNTYVEDMKEMFDKINVPIILFWFSKRKPGSLFLSKHKSNHNKFYGDFPQLIDKDTLDKVRKHTDAYGQVCSTAGLPNKFMKNGKVVKLTYSFRKKYDRGDRLANKAKTSNSYYPSPKMHKLAAKELTPICEGFLK